MAGNKIGSSIFEYRDCVECKSQFFITWGQKAYFESIIVKDEKTGKDGPMSLPKRCQPCRRKNNPKPISHPREAVIGSVERRFGTLSTNQQ